MSSKPSEFEQHQFLAKLIDGSQKRDKAHLKRVKSTLNTCKTEEKLPELAFMAYCYLGDLPKVKQLLPKIKKIDSSALYSYLPPAIEGGNAQILELLLGNIIKIPNDLIRSSLTKACYLGNNKHVELLLSNGTNQSFDEATIRYASINALLDEKINIFCTLSRHTKSEWLDGLISHINSELKGFKGGKDYKKELYSQGIKILKQEKTKRDVIKKLGDNKEIEI